VNVIDNPLQCVCMGTAKIVENLDHYRKVLLNSTR
jgi:actin-like ATPase involved in cell morphogenesis